ncbi:hypothetical protein C0J08_17065 [Marinomonas sp. CT5]|nr:hypothetical protein C0J08_17065 [Marinomonas sp. CT5]
MNFTSRNYMPVVLGALFKTSTRRYHFNGVFVLIIFLCLPFINGCARDETQPNVNAPHISKEAPPADILSSNTDIEALLNAEFILQREGPNKAFTPFYELASESGDIKLIERLTHIAVVSQNPIFIERSTNLWLSSDPTSETAYSLKLQVLLKDNRTEEVTTLLTNATRHKVSLRFLPLYLEDHVRDAEQINSLDKAIAALPAESQKNQFVQLSKAHLLLLAGKYQQAINTAEQLLAQDNSEKTETLYLILAFSQKNHGDLNNAIRTLQSAAIKFPNNTRILTPLVDFLVENKQSKSASDLFQTTHLETPEKLQVGINLMRALIEHEEPKLALSVADSLPKDQLGLSNQINYLTAIALAKQNKMTQAIGLMKSVDGALQINAINQVALWLYEDGKESDINNMVLQYSQRENIPEQVDNISRLHEEKGRIDLSYDLINHALISHPNSDTLRYRKALTAEQLGDWDVTETELKYLLEKDPENPQYLNALGYTLLVRTTRINEAMGYIESAYEKASSDPAIIDSLGWGFFLKGEFEQSSYYLKKAWSLLPDAEIAAHYGESLWKQRHYNEAIEIWKTALKTSPRNHLLLDTIQRLSPSLLEEQKQDNSP